MSEAGLIKADTLLRRFGPFTAVDGISLEVRQGEVLGLLGPNGAGKTTTIKMLTGYLPPTSGQAAICGHDVATHPIEARELLGYLPEGAPLYDDMTPLAFLRFVGQVRGLKGAALNAACTRAAEAVHIGPVLHQPIETLSKGYRRRVGLAQAILHDPKVLILDEPTDGLDPNQKFEVRRLIESMAPDKAIIISTHILEEVEALCSRAVIIDSGRIVADGTPADLKKRSRRHGAVSVEVDRTTGDAAAAVLNKLDGISLVERRDDRDFSHLLLYPAGPQSVLEPARTALDGSGIVFRQISLEPGRLEDVFRSLTHTDPATDSARTEEETLA